MPEEHSISWSEFGDFVQSTSDKVSGSFREFLSREIRRFAIDNCLILSAQELAGMAWMHTLNWLKILSYVSGG